MVPGSNPGGDVPKQCSNFQFIGMSEHRLGEIVIERPRGGRRISATKLTGYNKELDWITKDATEDGLFCHYLIKPRRKSKWLSDNLGPLRRLLRSQVGKPWNDTHSKLCRSLDSRTMVGRHVLDHLWDYVERHVELVDGVPCRKHGSYYGSLQLTESYRPQYYVHPQTGLLCAVPSKSRKQKPKVSKDILRISSKEEYRRINEVWYRISFEPLQGTAARDVLLKVQITPQEALNIYGKCIYAATKKQCGKRELKQIQL